MSKVNEIRVNKVFGKVWHCSFMQRNPSLKVELYFSALHFLSGNPQWFCRLWCGFKFKESYGVNKFDAYRKALNSNLN